MGAASEGAGGAGFTGSSGCGGFTVVVAQLGCVGVWGSFMGGGWIGDPQGLSRGERVDSEPSPAGVVSPGGLVTALAGAAGSLSDGNAADEANVTGSGWAMEDSG